MASEKRKLKLYLLAALDILRHLRFTSGMKKGPLVRFWNVPGFNDLTDMIPILEEDVFAAKMSPVM